MMTTETFHILVASHRRSGTHLTIDAIRNNFQHFENSNFLVLDQLEANSKKSISFDKLHESLLGNNTVLKSHFLKDHYLHFQDRSTEAEYLENLLENTPKIYVYRDGRDVMVSLFHYLKSYHGPSKSIGFKDFLHSENHFGPQSTTNLNRIEFWKLHVESWLDRPENILFLSFEELVGSYEETLGKIAGYLNIPVNEKIIDVRLKPKNIIQKIREKLSVSPKYPKIQRTEVLFHRGIPGRYKAYFEEDDLDFFNDHAGDLLKRLGYD